MIRFAGLVALALCLALAWWGVRTLVRPFAGVFARVGAWLRPAAPFLAAAVVLFGDLALDAVGSFGIVDRMDETFNRAAGLISGPFYGGLDRPGQKAIVIVALDEGFVERSGGVWPPPYRATQDVLEQILQAKPKAVLLDTYYNHPRRTSAGWPDVAGIHALADTIAQRNSDRIPILTGPVSTQQPVLSPLAEVVEQVGLTLDDDRPYAYNVMSDEMGEPKPMAATALYRIWAKKGPSKSTQLPMETLSIDWGFGASKWMNERLEGGYAPCVTPTLRSRGERSLRLVWRAVAPNLQRDDLIAEGLVVACPYFDIVPAAWLSAPEVQARLKGNLVLVGSTVPWVRDQAPTPLLGEVPGVMVHAMALDNLIQSGAQATRYPMKHEDLWDLDNGDFVEAALLLLGFALIWLLHRLFELPPDHALSFKAKMGVWGAVAVLGLAIACFNHWPLFKLLTAALTGGVALEAWDEFQKHRRRRLAEHLGET